MVCYISVINQHIFIYLYLFSIGAEFDKYFIFRSADKQEIVFKTTSEEDRKRWMSFFTHAINYRNERDRATPEEHRNFINIQHGVNGEGKYLLLIVFFIILIIILYLFAFFTYFAYLDITKKQKRSSLPFPMAMSEGNVDKDKEKHRLKRTKGDREIKVEANC